jgi:hypothetical protein
MECLFCRQKDGDFQSCNILPSSVTNMRAMFAGTPSFKSRPIKTHQDPSRPIIMGCFFCHLMHEGDVSSFNQNLICNVNIINAFTH